MTETAIEIKNISKKYPGALALDEISVNFPKGQITGLVGPNGSGKSTLLKIITGLVVEDSGQVKINDLKDKRLMDQIAFLPEINHLYDWMTIKEAINFFSNQYSDFSTKKANELLDFMNLSFEQKIKALSKGMVARLKLVLVLARRAPLLILDEPLSGIDPNSRARILESLISEYESDFQSIVISTHEVVEAERFFDHVVFLEEGKVLLEGNTDDLRAERNKSVQELVREVFK
ncbi:MAG: ABC transporter ATP-binding protein [Halanaerobiales bacterium]|nr:ABC transporter ATP-binding protein [Halanaerobiales bacterium]